MEIFVARTHGSIQRMDGSVGQTEGSIRSGEKIYWTWSTRRAAWTNSKMRRVAIRDIKTYAAVTYTYHSFSILLYHTYKSLISGSFFSSLRRRGGPARHKPVLSQAPLRDRVLRRRGDAAYPSGHRRAAS